MPVRGCRDRQRSSGAYLTPKPGPALNCTDGPVAPGKWQWRHRSVIRASGSFAPSRPFIQKKKDPSRPAVEEIGMEVYCMNGWDLIIPQYIKTTNIRASIYH
jgi:hypothetical protein